MKISNIGAWIGILLLIAIVTITILTLLGPAIGNTFSGITTAYNPGYLDPHSSSEPAAPVSAANWDVELMAQRPANTLIIKNGEMYLLVEDTHRAIERIMLIATRYGGYVQSSEVYGEGDQVGADLTIIVRSQDFEAAFDDLREVALDVQHERATGEDVSAEYVDLDSRLRNLQATSTRLHTFLDDSESVTEALAVSAELKTVEAEIEQVKGRMQYLEERAAMSTINVHLQMPAAQPTPTPLPEWGIQPTIERSVQAQIGLVQFLAESLTWLLIVIGPYALIAAAVVYGVRMWMHKRKGQGNQTGTA